MATVPVAGGTVALFAHEAVDLEAEAQRTERARTRLEAELERAEGKLANQRFVAQGAGPGRPGRARQARARCSAELGGRSGLSWSLERGAEEHLLSLELFGMNFGLERMRRLLTAMGSPQRAFRAIHVVGSNGKSSTARMTAAMLEAHGVRTGAFLSPHLEHFAERIRIGDADLDPAGFGAAIERAAAAAAKVERTLSDGDRVTQFELMTAAAFAELAARASRSASWRPGLGGRHDATNVLDAPVVVLTNVGLEHTRWLGPTITDIAREKLAVVAPGATLVVGPHLKPRPRPRPAKVDARVRARRRRGRDVAPRCTATSARTSRSARAAAAALHRPARPGRGAVAAARVHVPGRLQRVAERR